MINNGTEGKKQIGRSLVFIHLYCFLTFQIIKKNTTYHISALETLHFQSMAFFYTQEQLLNKKQTIFW